MYLVILDDLKWGEVVCSLLVDGKCMFECIIVEDLFVLKGVIGFWLVYWDGDDVVLFEDEV